MEKRGHRDTAHRLRALLGRVFRYAIVTGRADRDPAADLKGALLVPKTKHMAAILDPKEIGPLMRAIEGYEGSKPVVAALQLLPHVFVRSKELRWAAWSEFDLDSATWRIPPDRMKMGLAHIVPLSRQSLAILRELRSYKFRGELLFLSNRGRPPD